MNASSGSKGSRHDVVRPAICAPKSDARAVRPTEQLKVRQPIVRLDAVDVMDVLARQQWSAEGFGNNEPVLGDVAACVAHRCGQMRIADHHVNVSLPHRSAAAPRWVFRP